MPGAVVQPFWHFDFKYPTVISGTCSVGKFKKSLKLFPLFCGVRIIINQYNLLPTGPHQGITSTVKRPAFTAGSCHIKYSASS